MFMVLGRAGLHVEVVKWVSAMLNYNVPVDIRLSTGRKVTANAVFILHNYFFLSRRNA